MTATKYVFIHGISDLMELVREATKVEGDILCKKGKYVVDAKSLMGMMSIDPSTGVTFEYPEEATEFGEFLNKFTKNANREG